MKAKATQPPAKEELREKDPPKESVSPVLKRQGSQVDKQPTLHRANSRMMSELEIKQRSVMSGASAEKIHRAFSTHENVVGPGAYDGVNRSMFGGKQGSSKKLNAPGFSFGKSTSKVALNPENKGSIQSPHNNPSPLDYQVPSDNFRFRKNSMRLDRNQDRFFKPTNMPKISEQTPV